MSTPGPVMSGFSPWAPAGPRLEKPATVSVRSTAPTVSADSATPMELMVEVPGP
ncbi:hypothetical protein GCM10027161_07900 [Microbispora hainanensis]